MPSLGSVRTAANQALDSRLTTLTSRQESHLGSLGRYWHVPWSHSTAPAHTSSQDGSVPPDRMAARASDLPQGWRDFFAELEGVSLPCRIAINAYQGPQGQGWEVVIELVHQGSLYRRIVAVGPESYRSRGWYQPGVLG